MLEARARTHPPPFTLDVTGGRRRREEGSCQVDAEWQKSCEPDKRVSKSSIHPLSLLFHLISPIHKCHLAPKNSSQRQRRRPPPQSDGSAARLPSGKKQPISSARSVSPCQLGICENPAKTGQLTRDMQAAVAYKIDNKWQESGQAYERCVFGIPFICLCIHNMCKCLTDHREAACRLRLNENNDAMNAFHNAAKSYKKSNPEGVCRPICHLIRVEELQLKRTDRF